MFIPANDNVAPAKYEPEMNTMSPGLAVVGVMSLMTGTSRTKKLASALPPTVVTVTFCKPDNALAGTSNVMVVSVTTADTSTGPIFVVAPVKFCPVIVTVVPRKPLVGESEIDDGGSLTVND